MKRVKEFFVRVPYASAIIIAAAQFVLAASANAQSGIGGTLPGISANTDIGTFLDEVICNSVAYYMFIILIGLAVVFVLVAAYQYLTSGGDEGKVHDATMKITYAAVAVAVSLVAKAFPVIVGSIVAPGTTLTGTCQ